MTFTDAIILAVVQGLTEFLPISSSGHLVLAEHLLHMADPEKNLPFVLVLHLASLLAVFVYYARSLRELVSERRLMAYLVLASIPIGLVGVFLGKRIEALQSYPVLVCAMLIVNGAFLFFSDRFGKGSQPMDEAPEWKAILIGIAQAIRLPGLSRSGSTIGTGWLCGIARPDAVRFSFFLSIPAVLGASAWKARHLLKGEALHLPSIPVTLVAVVVCFLLSLASIRVVEKLAAGRRWLFFAVYSVVVGAAGLVYFLAN